MLVSGRLTALRFDPEGILLSSDSPEIPRRFPVHGAIGGVLIAVFWPLNWLLEGMRTHWGFFPLWLGFCLLVDALVVKRKGHSLLTRSPLAYAGLFMCSVPSWWLFELINERTRNWVYLSDGSLGPVSYFLLASLSFSTVIPAVFGASEFVGTFRVVRELPTGPRIVPTPAVLRSFLLAGLAALALTLLWPTYFYPFVWLSIFFILEPINFWLGNRTLLTSTAEGDWRPVVSLWAGALACGLFWELWNFYSFPKWTYQVPFVDFLRIFEMPILGYGGYLPFALELYALYHLIVGSISRFRTRPYLELIDGTENGSR